MALAMKQEENKEEQIKSICEWGKERLQTLKEREEMFISKIQTQIQARKNIIIKEIARRLIEEAQVPKRQINALICRQLKGYVSKQHVTKTLSEDLKDIKKRSHDKMARRLEKANGKSVYHKTNGEEVEDQVTFTLDQKHLAEKICRGLKAGVETFSITGSLNTKRILAVDLLQVVKHR